LLLTQLIKGLHRPITYKNYPEITMKLAEYNLLTEHFEMDMDLYRQLLKDAATASPDRVNAILGIFTCLHVDESWDGDVEEIKAEGMAEIMGNTLWGMTPLAMPK
jgi:hypothetical protein